MTKKRKIWVIILAFFFVAVLTSTFFINSTTNSQEKEVELKFGDNFISYVMENNDVMSFNIFGVQDIREQDFPIEDQVTAITFNNPNIKVADFEVSAGMSLEGYKLLNILVTVQLSSNSLETANEILIQFNNGKTTTREFGEMVLQNSNSFQKAHLAPSGDYKIGYPNLALDVNIKNTDKQDINAAKIYDLTEGILYQFKDSFQITPGEVKHIQIDEFDHKIEHDFMTVTPILSYSLEGREYLYNMPGVIYGILDPDEDKINKIIN
jgi:hypothetical protein